MRLYLYDITVFPALLCVAVRSSRKVDFQRSLSFAVDLFLLSVDFETNPVILVQVLLSDRRIWSASTNDGIWASGVRSCISLLFCYSLTDKFYGARSLANQGMVCMLISLAGDWDEHGYLGRALVVYTPVDELQG